MKSFEELFKRATGYAPFPFQSQFATEREIPELVSVPTGLGKTAMAVLGWLWRRRFADTEIRRATPRRLVYCLPMRVLVEQTRDNAVLWLDNLRLLGGEAEWDEPDGRKKLRSYVPDINNPEKTAVHILMGGEDEEDWDIYPERDQVIIGTQDMLLSRALNRGYAASRSRWPIQFGMLNNDCLWIFDEVQLMGSGLATTTQLEGLRRLLGNKVGHGCKSVWMSATMQPDWLNTVDFSPFSESVQQLTFAFNKEIVEPNLDLKSRERLKSRWEAKKPLTPTESAADDAEGLAKEVLKEHRAGMRTIVVLNTVGRARKVYDALKTANDGTPIVLLHSRFRPGDRRSHIDQALTEPSKEGTIIVSTQVIEAGVDVSAAKMFTEVAPWASLVQRFGRCNRRGEHNSDAKVYWTALSAKKEEDARKAAKPYDLDDITEARERLLTLKDVGLASLPTITLAFEHTHVIRRKDMVDLFDTTPDLAGNDIDIDRFIRDVDDSDVRIFWRDYGENPNEVDGKEAQPAPRREELCPAPIGSKKNPGFREFVNKHKGKVWLWSFLSKKWERADPARVIPGQVFLVRRDAGGYDAGPGWAPDSKRAVTLLELPAGTGKTPEATEDDTLARIGIWQTIAQHTDEDYAEMGTIVETLSMSRTEAAALRHAVRWHDRGKAHDMFQAAIDDGGSVRIHGNEISRRERPPEWQGCLFIAKAPNDRKNATGEVVEPGYWRPYDWPPGGRKYFRHELASAMAVLDPRNRMIPDEIRDLAAYLIAAHHGKVRLSIRSLPNETRPPDSSLRFARGIRDKDDLPETDLGGGVIAPAVRLSLEPMELGLCEQEPFKGWPSWAERMLRLRDTLGPFRLAYLEAILRAADMRASGAAAQRKVATDPQPANQKGGDGND